MNLIAAALTPLILTLPTMNAGTGPLPCIGSTQTQDLKEVRVYRQIGSGPFVLHAAKDVGGREGQTDTVWVDPGGGATFHATVLDTTGNESCPSAALYLGPIPADDSQVVDRLLQVRYYDVQGRRVSGRHARGVYWEIRRYLSGRTETKKVVLLR